MDLSLTVGNGLNADALSSELADGFVNACSNMRFSKGFGEMLCSRMSTIGTFTGSPAWLGQLSIPSAAYIVGIGEGTRSAGAFKISGGPGGPTDITRKVEGVAIANATAAGTTVTITTLTAHGRSTGNIISAWGFTPSTYNVESASITVTGATTFTYTVASAPSVSPATAFGMYSRDAVTSAFSSMTYTDTGGELNGILLVNSCGDGCYYWNGDTNLPLRKVVGSYAARVSIPFGNFIVQLAPTISGTEYPYRICWSTSAEPGSVPHNGFTSTNTNQAGDVDKPEIGEMVFAEPLGDDLIVYGTKGRLVMRYIDGNAVFSFTVLPGNEGLYSSKCVAAFPGGHVYVDRSRHIRLHTGDVSTDIGEGRVQSIIGADGCTPYGVVAHLRRSEIWIYYQTSTASAGVAAEYALIWNWNEQTWGQATLTNAKAGVCAKADYVFSGLTHKYPLFFIGGSTNGTLFEADSQYGNEAITSSFERSGITAGDPSIFKNLQRSNWPIDNVAALSATFTVEHGSSKFPDTAPTYAASVAYTPGTTDWANARATSGKFMAVRWTGTTSLSKSTPGDYHSIRVRSVKLDFTLGGKR